MSYKYKLLSIDGGGIRGIIPAIILQEIERRIQKPIWQLFDLIAGTSTGGILSLGLTMPNPDHKQEAYHTIEDIINIYRQDGKRIFYEPPLERWTKVDDLTRPKFSSKGREEVVKKYLKNTSLSDALTNIFITSYDIEQRLPVFFISRSSFQKPCGGQFRKLCDGYTMNQAAMATSAAPSYFEPYKVPAKDSINGGYYALIDGGVFANNPTSLAIIEAMVYSQSRDSQFEQKQLSLEDILVVSLGTGSLTRRYKYDEAINWGRLEWIQPALNIVSDSASEMVSYQLQLLLPEAQNVHKQYYRFQKELTEANDDMDDVSDKNIQDLEAVAHEIIQETSTDLDKLCEQLSV